MAQKIRWIRLTWENDVSFEMDTKLDSGDWGTVTQMDENGYFSSLWDSTASICKKYFENELDNIGSEMKS